MSFIEKIINLINLTENSFNLNNFNLLIEEIKCFSSFSSDIGIDIEIVFRETINKLLKQNNVTLIISFLSFLSFFIFIFMFV